MMDGLRDQIARLRSLSPELNAVTDEAARLVQAVEHFLNEECKFGIPAYTHISTSTEEEDRHGADSGTRLEYTRIDGVFRLAVSEYFSGPDGETSIHNRMAWSAAPRDVKLWTISLIPGLLDSIAKRVEATINQAQRDSERVRTYLRQLGVDASAEIRMPKASKPRTQEVR